MQCACGRGGPLAQLSISKGLALPMPASLLGVWHLLFCLQWSRQLAGRGLPALLNEWAKLQMSQFCLLLDLFLRQSVPVRSVAQSSRNVSGAPTPYFPSHTTLLQHYTLPQAMSPGNACALLIHRAVFMLKRGEGGSTRIEICPFSLMAFCESADAHLAFFGTPSVRGRQTPNLKSDSVPRL